MLLNKYFSIVIVSIVLQFVGVTQSVFSQTLTVDEVLMDNEVLVASKHCDWAAVPENSIQTLKFYVEMGVDIAIISLKKTKDNHLILMHDISLDRTTTGTGNAEDYSLEEIKKLRLKDGKGNVTQHAIPTFEEFLIAARNRIVVSVENVYPYYEPALEIVRRLNLTQQVIFNLDNNISYDSLVSKHGKPDAQLYLKIAIDATNPSVNKIIESYKSHKKTIFRLVLATDKDTVPTKVVEISKLNPIWVNALWQHHNSNLGLDEKQLNDAWSLLIKQGAKIIQTNKPAQLAKYIHQLKFYN
jgi:glycerophosphoryl diester phosphodiesterase